MKTKHLGALVLFLSTLNPQLSTLFAQGTAFTYQGRVLDNGTNFTGTGQFKFALVTSTNTSHQAAATANLTGPFVTSYTIVDPGAGYTAAPAVTITGGGGSGATATATVSNGMVIGLAANGAGSGYSSPPTVTIAPPTPNISYTTYWSNDGTSSAGSEPAAAVNVSVSSGLFTVVLGDSTLANMIEINTALFAQPKLQLRVWFNDGANGFAPLSPVQSLTPAPYASFAYMAGSLPGMMVQSNTNGAPNVVGGSSVNYVAPGVSGATISGGGTTNYLGYVYGNSVAADYGSIGGGIGNTIQISADNSVISGGDGNEIRTNADDSTIGGGHGNLIFANAGISTIGGGVDSSIGFGAYDSTIGGGYVNAIQDLAHDSTIGGGIGNIIGITASDATIAGGYGNTIGTNAYGGSVGGGRYNVVLATDATISGGNGNQIGSGGMLATIGGGLNNSAQGNYATVPGGYFNTAGGTMSFAAGRQAKANHSGTFVWADDSTTVDFTSTSLNQFLVRAAGGVGINTTAPGGAFDVATASGSATVSIRNESSVAALVMTAGAAPGVLRIRNALEIWPNTGGTTAGRLDVRTTSGTATISLTGSSGNITCVSLTQTSDRNVKTGFEPVNARDVLEQVTKLPLMKWAYTNDASVRHLGPMAQDFYAAFNVGADNTHIATVDEEGVALAAIQGLNEKVEVRMQNAEVRSRKLEQKLEQKETEITELNQRLEALEKVIRNQQSN